MDTESTICAIATPPGQGAIAVIRLSGPKTFRIMNEVFHPSKKGSRISKQKGYTLHHGHLMNGKEVLDEVIVSVFRNPHSYTGEDVVEISCHGSVYIQQQILELLINKGARLAGPGEFTQRAFLNGKMDLSQAEGVADLIASESAAAHRMAINQMRGGFSEELRKLRNRLLQFISLIELELDFSEEDVEFADRQALNILVKDIKELTERLVRSFQYGNVIKKGVPVAIVGKPNVGKSTLLNNLLKEDKAIVSEFAGTTRDVIEDTIVLDGIMFRFIDTAGLRETSDFIENLGIRKTYQKIRQASIILLLADARDPLDIICESYNYILKQEGMDEKQVILLVNKADKLDPGELKDKFNDQSLACLRDQDRYQALSAKDQKQVHVLAESLVKEFYNTTKSPPDVIVSNARHYDALSHSLEATRRVEEGLSTGLSTDLLAQDIREILHYLGEITGQITTDEILGNIFQNFCIGK